MNIKEWFYFPRSDRKVLLALLIVGSAALLGVWFLGGSNRQTTLTAADSAAIMQQRQQKGYSYYRKYPHRRSKWYYDQGTRQKIELSDFDPNTADSFQLLKLGLKPWMVRNIYKYREAGGIYRQPKDFARLYGLTVKQYKMLEPYIHISKEFLDASTIYNYEPATERDTIRSPIKIKPQERVVLNKADTNQLKKIPGIGSHFARHIVQYRERLGGFYSINQLREIEDFPEMSLNYFVIPDDQLRKINLNSLTLEQLRRHPYINFHMAKAIVDYRRLKGPLRSLQDLRLVRDFTPEAIQRLEPYVEFGD